MWKCSAAAMEMLSPLYPQTFIKALPLNKLELPISNHFALPFLNFPVHWPLISSEYKTG